MTAVYETDEARGDAWTLMLGDACERLGEIADDSIDLSVYSPPFAALFVYSDTDRDLGNSSSRQQFLEHYGFVIRENLRVTKPGRIACVHVQQLTTTKASHGYMGLTDFRGQVIAAYQQAGWHFHGEATIWKDPQCLRDGTPVLTPTGWTTIEALAVGDRVIGADGAATKVVDVPYRGVQPIYRVTFDDGAEVECGPEHLWTVRASAHSPWRTVRTNEMCQKGSRTPGGGWRFQVPVTEPVQYDPAPELPVHPRLLGALLADGSWAGQRSVSITKDRDLVESLPLPEGHRVTYRPGSDRAEGRTATYAINGPGWRDNAVLRGLRELGLDGCRAWEKHVPRRYLTADEGSRRELLRGLLDGDGRITSKGAIYYRTTSPQLAGDIVDLVRSLGGLATSRESEGGRYGDGKQGRPIWEISVRLTGPWCPFTLARKAERWTSGRRGIHRHVVSIEQTGESGPCTCISVAAQDGLFVTEGHVVTHNSQSIRTRAHALAFQTKNRDSAGIRPALADYLLIFRKPGDNAVRIPHSADEPPPGVSNDDWISWASPIWLDSTDGGGLDGEHLSPVWLDIRETRTLNERLGREPDDGRHICPLQLGFIERCVRLWSNPGETVLSPFAGIGSEIYTAVKLGRRGVGVELKRSYWTDAVKVLRELDEHLSAPALLDLDEVTA